MTASHVLPRADITGLVLAGGRGSRMGGADKGLQLIAGDGGAPSPLALVALRRLAPQADRLMVSANRHLDAYRAFGAPVVADDDSADGPVAFDGPLAGMLAGLRRCQTPWLACVPCDAPRFPRDLVERLAAGALAEGSRLAVACTSTRPQPVFCLLHVELEPSLRVFLAGGGRAALRFADACGAARVAFADDDAFFNANTPGDLDLASARRLHAA